VFRFPLDAVFMYGTKDIYREWFTAHELYLGETLILWYDQGHTFPRSLAKGDSAKLLAFVNDAKRFLSASSSNIEFH
jgi:hypothetical protein